MRSRLSLALLFVALFATMSFAGTGGSELASWYSDLTDALEGTWGKIGALALIIMAIMVLKNGGILGGAFLFFLGISIGTIPDIVDSHYTMLF